MTSPKFSIYLLETQCIMGYYSFLLLTQNNNFSKPPSSDRFQLCFQTDNLWGLSYITYIKAVFNLVSKVISRLLWFCITTLCDWLIKLVPLSQPIICKTKTNHASLACAFLCSTLVTCLCFEFLLVHCAVCTCCDWPEYYYFGFGFTTLD